MYVCVYTTDMTDVKPVKKSSSKSSKSFIYCSGYFIKMSDVWFCLLLRSLFFQFSIFSIYILNCLAILLTYLFSLCDNYDSLLMGVVVCILPVQWAVDKTSLTQLIIFCLLQWNVGGSCFAHHAAHQGARRSSNWCSFLLAYFQPTDRTKVAWAVCGQTSCWSPLVKQYSS